MLKRGRNVCVCGAALAGAAVEQSLMLALSHANEHVQHYQRTASAADEVSMPTMALCKRLDSAGKRLKVCLSHCGKHHQRASLCTHGYCACPSAAVSSYLCASTHASCKLDFLEELLQCCDARRAATLCRYTRQICKMHERRSTR